MNYNELIPQFYDAFENGHADIMASCYHDNIVFTDPAFGTLKGKRASNMWKMLLSQKNTNTKISYTNVLIDGNKGSVNWTAEYNYGPKKRKVINKITANFKFKDGKIIEHIDDFNLWSWCKQALGPIGLFLGWSSFMKNKIQKMTNSKLDAFISKQTL